MSIQKLIYKTLNNSIDCISGFQLNKATKWSLEFDQFQRTDLDSYQRLAFNRLKVFSQQSTFYSKYKDASLEDYPVIDRDIYKQHNLEMKARGHPYTISRTSGSTGTPAHIHVSREMLIAKRAAHQRMLSWYGLEREDPEFQIGGLKSNYKKHIYYLMRNKRYINSFQLNSNTINKHIKNYNSFKPKVLIGYPSSINRFLELSKNTFLHKPNIIVTHAENLEQSISNNILSAFRDSKLVNQYWSTEGNIGVSCPAGNIHFDEETIIPEIINQDESGTGELIITNLFSYDLPIIRYKIGDRVKISPSPCPCGRKTKTIEKLDGRSIDLFHLSGNRTIPFIGVISAYLSEQVLSLGIQQYQIVHSRSKQEIQFTYTASAPLHPDTLRPITHYLQEKTHNHVKINYQEKIDPEPNGKFKKFKTQDI